MNKDPMNIMLVILLSLSAIFSNYFLKPMRKAVLKNTFNFYPNRDNILPREYVTANLVGLPAKMPRNDPNDKI